MFVHLIKPCFLLTFCIDYKFVCLNISAVVLCVMWHGIDLTLIQIALSTAQHGF